MKNNDFASSGRTGETEGIAFLSNGDGYTFFSYGKDTIKFLTSKRLKRYTRIKEWKWNMGYLVVDCEYKDSTFEEDYIDLIPILNNLYINPDTFLKDIKEVRLSYVD